MPCVRGSVRFGRLEVLELVARQQDVPGAVIVRRIQTPCSPTSEQAAVGAFFALEQFLGRILLAVVPGHLARGQLDPLVEHDGRAFGEVVFEDRVLRIALVLDDSRGRLDVDRDRIEEFQRHDGHVGRMAGHVAQGAGPEIEPAAPFEGMIDAGDVGPLRRGAEEQVPVNVFRNRVAGINVDDLVWS